MASTAATSSAPPPRHRRAARTTRIAPPASTSAGAQQKADEIVVSKVWRCRRRWNNNAVSSGAGAARAMAAARVVPLLVVLVAAMFARLADGGSTSTDALAFALPARQFMFTSRRGATATATGPTSVSVSISQHPRRRSLSCSRRRRASLMAVLARDGDGYGCRGRRSSPGTTRTSDIILRASVADDRAQQQQQQQQQQHSSASSIGLNPLVSSVKISKTVEIFSLVKEMEAEGRAVTSLCVGEPDFPPPRAVLDAAVEAITSGKTTYTAVTGTVELRRAIADDLRKRKGIEYDPATDVVVGNGAKQCVYQAMLATVGAGDEVVVPAPYWPSYPEMATLVGAKPVILETDKRDGYLLTPGALRDTLEKHPKARLLILCNPSNPTGGVHDGDRLKELASVLSDFPNVAILADEIYERLVYSTDNPRHVSFASVPGMFGRTITVNGFSKSHAMTGFRLGYLAAPTPVAKACATIQSQLTSCAGSVSQAAGLAALTRVSEEEMEANVRIMVGKRDFVLGELGTMWGVSVEVVPGGAFYVLPDVSGYFDGDDATLCLELLRRKGLALVPGSSFGAPGTVRISYATSMEELQVAMDKLRQFLKEEREK